MTEVPRPRTGSPVAEPARAVPQLAKEPVSPVLAGPYGHPFHPMLVTIPIGGWVCSLVFDLGSRITRDEALATSARWLIAMGLLGALAAAGVGFLDFAGIPSGTRAHRVAVAHMSLALAVTGGFAVDLAWRLHQATVTPVGPLLLTLALLAILGLAGALGGHLAFHYGVRVAAEDVQAEGFRAPEGAPGGQIANGGN